MAVDKNKIIAEATKLVQKGALDKAIAAYQKITAEDPKDVRILLKIGELYQKKGDDKLAADAFQKVADTYAEQGFFLKSVAVYKQIAKLDPEDVRVNERLAGLYQQLGLMSDAMSQLQFMATAHEKAGDGARLTDVLKRMVELDPDNIASSIKLGELHARANQPGPALECFKRAADYLKKHSRADEYLKVAERIAALQPDDLALTRELAHIYLAKGDTKRALAKLQLSFKADPKDVGTLQLLAQAFRDLGQTSKTVSVYKELARVHEEQGRAGEARSTWRKVQELAPDDDEAAHALGTGPARATPPPLAAPAPPPGRPPGAAPPPGRPPGAGARTVLAPPPPPRAAAPAPGGADATIPKLLTETDVYVKYGLHDKALEHLRRVLALDPHSAEALERARELHVATGQTAEAAQMAVLAVRALLSRGEGDRARDAVARLRQIAPDHPELSSLNGAAGGTEEVALEPADEVAEVQDLDAGPAVDDDALALAAAGEGGDEVIDDEPLAAAPEGEPLEIAPEPVDGDGLDAAGDALAEAAALASAADVEVVEDEPLAPPPAPPPARRAPPPGPPPGARAAPAAPARRAAPPPPPAEDEEADLSDELEEADFFLQQGLLDDARDALKNLLTFYPGHRAVEEKLADVERRAAASARRPAAGGAVRESPALVAASSGDESFDIARELAEELGPPGEAAPAEDEFQYSVEDVFSQFKKGVEQTVKQEDTATHYDLGIAYKEMGLLDDAVHEFEIALKGNDRKKEVDCLSMIALCRVQQEKPRDAIAAWRRALGSEHLTRDAAKALHFELGAAHEAAGDREVALHFLQKVNKVDPAYRGVGEKVKALGGGPGTPPPDDRPAAKGANGAASPPKPAGPARPPAPVAGAKKNIGYL
jgi:tetratricopeptide (TPR) repeat protein